MNNNIKWMRNPSSQFIPWLRRSRRHRPRTRRRCRRPRPGWTCLPTSWGRAWTSTRWSCGPPRPRPRRRGRRGWSGRRGRWSLGNKLGQLGQKIIRFLNLQLPGNARKCHFFTQKISNFHSWVGHIIYIYAMTSVKMRVFKDGLVVVPSPRA